MPDLELTPYGETIKALLERSLNEIHKALANGEEVVIAEGPMLAVRGSLVDVLHEASCESLHSAALVIEGLHAAFQFEMLCRVGIEGYHDGTQCEAENEILEAIENLETWE